jgi:undecaprenyl-diphosphatase
MEQQNHRHIHRLYEKLESPRFFVMFVSIALLYVAGLTSGLVEDVLDNETIVRVDGWFVHWLAAHRTPAGIRLFAGISLLGNWQLAVALLALVALLLWKHRRTAAMTLALACAGSEATVFLGKAGFGRPRPPAVLAVVQELDASFPSGHANISVALYALGCYVLFRAARSRKAKRLWLALGCLLPLAIGFSRLYLGAHYLSDVLAGWAVGCWWSLLALGLFGYLRRRRTVSYASRAAVLFHLSR